jgi:glycosyltransferase involved in cell wall biosynthesis
MPELTVSMPAYNTARYIVAAIQSVLRQTGIEFELIVVDDASQDDTGAAVLSIKDPRVKLLTNTVNRGIAYCHNLVIKQSASPFIAHVDSDDLVLPHAFEKMVKELKSDPKIGQVHCYFFDVDEDGTMTLDALRARRESFLKERKPDMDYKLELLVRGNVINHLRIYNREVFNKVGRFNENLRYGEDYEMALRIIDKFDIKLVQEFLYCRRLHENSTTKRMGFTNRAMFLQRISICRQLSKSNQVGFLKERQYDLKRLLLKRLYRRIRNRTLYCIGRITSR